MTCNGGPSASITVGSGSSSIASLMRQFELQSQSRPPVRLEQEKRPRAMSMRESAAVAADGKTSAVLEKPGNFRSRKGTDPELSSTELTSSQLPVASQGGKQKLISSDRMMTSFKVSSFNCQRIDEGGVTNSDVKRLHANLDHTSDFIQSNEFKSRTKQNHSRKPSDDETLSNADAYRVERDDCELTGSNSNRTETTGSTDLPECNPVRVKDAVNGAEKAAEKDTDDEDLNSKKGQHDAYCEKVNQRQQLSRSDENLSSNGNFANEKLEPNELENLQVSVDDTPVNGDQELDDSLKSPVVETLSPSPLTSPSFKDSDDKMTKVGRTKKPPPPPIPKKNKLVGKTISSVADGSMTETLADSPAEVSAAVEFPPDTSGGTVTEATVKVDGNRSKEAELSKLERQTPETANSNDNETSHQQKNKCTRPNTLLLSTDKTDCTEEEEKCRSTPLLNANAAGEISKLSGTKDTLFPSMKKKRPQLMSKLGKSDDCLSTTAAEQSPSDPIQSIRISSSSSSLRWKDKTRTPYLDSPMSQGNRTPPDLDSLTNGSGKTEAFLQMCSPAAYGSMTSPTIQAEMDPLGTNLSAAESFEHTSSKPNDDKTMDKQVAPLNETFDAAQPTVMSASESFDSEDFISDTFSFLDEVEIELVHSSDGISSSNQCQSGKNLAKKETALSSADSNKGEIPGDDLSTRIGQKTASLRGSAWAKTRAENGKSKIQNRSEGTLDYRYAAKMEQKKPYGTIGSYEFVDAKETGSRREIRIGEQFPDKVKEAVANSEPDVQPQPFFGVQLRSSKTAMSSSIRDSTKESNVPLSTPSLKKTMEVEGPSSLSSPAAAAIRSSLPRKSSRLSNDAVVKDRFGSVTSATSGHRPVSLSASMPLTIIPSQRPKAGKFIGGNNFLIIDRNPTDGPPKNHDQLDIDKTIDEAFEFLDSASGV